jgi:hypothetical protein
MLKFENLAIDNGENLLSVDYDIVYIVAVSFIGGGNRRK